MLQEFVSVLLLSTDIIWNIYGRCFERYIASHSDLFTHKFIPIKEWKSTDMDFQRNANFG
jgi:hypothetical protein